MDIVRWLKSRTAACGPRKSGNFTSSGRIRCHRAHARRHGECTYCIQRIEGAKIAQKVKAGASDEIAVPDGTFTTACARPAGGRHRVRNLKDPDSRVSQLKQLDRNYSVLDFLLTKPRTTYLARVRNPNKAMPDFQETPLSFRNGKSTATSLNPQRKEPFMIGTNVQARPPRWNCNVRRSWRATMTSRGSPTRSARSSRARPPCGGGSPSSRAGAASLMPIVLLYQISTGIGVWGNDHPVMWAGTS